MPFWLQASRLGSCCYVITTRILQAPNPFATSATMVKGSCPHRPITITGAPGHLRPGASFTNQASGIAHINYRGPG